MSAVYRRGIEAEILADNQPHSVQLPDRYSRQVAWKPLSVRPALSIRLAGDLGRRIRRSVHSLGLDESRSLRSPMASTYGDLVLPPSRLVVGEGIEDHRSGRAPAPPIASPIHRLSRAILRGIVSTGFTGCLLCIYHFVSITLYLLCLFLDPKRTSHIRFHR